MSLSSVSSLCFRELRSARAAACLHWRDSVSCRVTGHLISQECNSTECASSQTAKMSHIGYNLGGQLMQ